MAMNDDPRDAEEILDRIAELNAKKETYYSAGDTKAILAVQAEIHGIKWALGVKGSPSYGTTNDPYTSSALERGRPGQPCLCDDCECDLHTYPDDDKCVWCRNDQHGRNHLPNTTRKL